MLDISLLVEYINKIMSKKNPKIPTAGGQAVIEGVMMRSGNTIATAVRRATGEIVTQKEERLPLSKKSKLLGLPIIRGALNMIDMLSVGIKTLNWSADIAIQDELKAEGKEPKKNSSSAASVALGLVIGVGLFVLLPMLIGKFLGLEKEAFAFNLAAGGTRVLIFFIYLISISFIPDVKRLFQYHGAEHKSIFAYEAGQPLTVANAQKYKTLHPRCGTSFLLIVVLISIIFFAIADSLIAIIFGFVPNIFARFGIHLLLWPIVIGLCYEFLKLSAKLSDKYSWARILIWPGLMLQKITTLEPTDEMVEVALTALKEAVGDFKVKQINNN